MGKEEIPVESEKRTKNGGKDKRLSFANELLSPTRLQYNKRPKAGFNIWNHLGREMFGWGEPGSLKPPGKENIVNFLYVPYQLECFLMLGLFMCLDAFLYIFTYLPLRVVLGTISLIQEIPFYILQLFASKQSIDKFYFRAFPRFHRTQGFDLMRAAMLFIAVYALQRINMSQAYHFIRGQSMIKLYVLMGMMEVVDKLLCSFGQDVFDALHNATRRAPTSHYTLFYFLISGLYVIVHAIFYFYQVATYMVVVNSADEALVTVLILNNFSELRGFVFKKFDANNLFQCACSDVSERFQIMLFLGVVFIVTLAQQTTPTSTLFSMLCISLSTFFTAVSGHMLQIMPSEIAGYVVGQEAAALLKQSDPSFDSTQNALYVTLLSMMRCMVLMVVGESLSDCVKHAFMNKFNAINASVYEDFAYILRSDLLNYQCDTIVLDHTYTVTRRLGLAQIPLAAVTLRFILLAVNRVVMVLDSSQTSFFMSSTAAGSSPASSSTLNPSASTNPSIFATPSSSSTNFSFISSIFDTTSSYLSNIGISLSSDTLQLSIQWAFWIFWVWVILVILKISLGVLLVVYADDRQRRDANYIYRRTPLEVDRLKVNANTPAGLSSISSDAHLSQTSSLFTSVSMHELDHHASALNTTNSTNPTSIQKELFLEPEIVSSRSPSRSTSTSQSHDAKSQVSFSTTAKSSAATAAPLTDSPNSTAVTSSDNNLSHLHHRDSPTLESMVNPQDILHELSTHAEGDDAADNSSEVSPQSQRTQERIDFLEKLATMERYTVYNGRII